MKDYIKKAVEKSRSNPKKIPTEIRRELNYGARCLNQYFYEIRGKPAGYNLLNTDWDTVIILDACRYDFFKNRDKLKIGDLQKRIAPGSESREFMLSQFKNNKIHDAVYVTGNPYTTLLEDDTFHNIYIDEAWDEEGKIVPAGRVTDIAIDAHRKHPNKRIIVHYMQPHLPILHEEQKHINDKLEPSRDQYWPSGTTMDKLREAYAANLEYVLNHVENLVDSITGKIIITSDHGELLGERQKPIPIRGTDHHPNLYVPELIEVPWLIINKGERREVVEDPPVGSLDIDEQTKKDRLEALGYL